MNDDSPVSGTSEVINKYWLKCYRTESTGHRNKVRKNFKKEGFLNAVKKIPKDQEG